MADHERRWSAPPAIMVLFALPPCLRARLAASPSRLPLPVPARPLRPPRVSAPSGGITPATCAPPMATATASSWSSSAKAQRRGPSDNPSAWRVDDLYLAHLALTDIDGRRFRYYRAPEPRRSGHRRRQFRAGPHLERQLAGRAGTSPPDARRFPPWPTTPLHPASDARSPHPSSTAKTASARRPRAPGKASYYVSFPRLAVEGTLNGAAVTGLAWMDHEWFTHQLDPDQQRLGLVQRPAR